MSEGSQVVKNKKASIKKADSIARKMLRLINLEVAKFVSEDNDEPAEKIYMLYYIAGKFNGYINSTLRGYGKTYGMENMTPQYTTPIIQYISDAVYDALNPEEKTL